MSARLAHKHDYEAGKLAKRLRRQVGQAIADYQMIVDTARLVVDTRGVTRLYAMTFAGGVWTLTRESVDFSPLDFAQRFTGTFSADGDRIDGSWEKRMPGGAWELDFNLTYTKSS